MSIMNRRNAVIGYLALQALKRSRRNATVGYLAAQGMERTRARRRSRHALKLTLYVLLGVVSLGALAAAAGIAAKRKQGSVQPEAPGAEASGADEPAPVDVETEPVVAT